MAFMIYRLTITAYKFSREPGAEVESIHLLTEEGLEHYQRVIIPRLPRVKKVLVEYLWVRDLEDVRKMERC